MVSASLSCFLYILLLLIRYIGDLYANALTFHILGPSVVATSQSTSCLGLSYPHYFAIASPPIRFEIEFRSGI